MPTPVRINAIDYFRGLVMAGVIINHLLLFPSLFELFTGRGLGWYSDAEAFFLLSGLTMGVVRAGGARREGLRSVNGKIARRAGKLYLWHVILSIVFIVLGQYFLKETGILVKGGLVADPIFPDLIRSIVTLQYAYGWSDFLMFYVPLLLISPLLIYLCHRLRWAWVVMVVASLTLYLALPFIPKGPYTYFGVWQAFFIVGLAMGIYYQNITGWWDGLTSKTRRGIGILLVTLAGLVYLGSMLITFIPTFFGKRQHLIGNEVVRNVVETTTNLRAALEPWLYNNRSGPLRLLVILSLLSGLLMIYLKYEKNILRYTGWFFTLLGRYSLHVFILQALFIFFVPLLQLPNNFVINTLFTTLMLMFFWALVRYKILFGIVPR
jgi:hypothetical protein